MTERRSLLSQTSLIFAGKAAGFVLAFWIPIALVRLLPIEQFGAYKQFFLVGATLISVLPMGLEASLFYFMPGDRPNAATYFRQTALCMFLMGLAAALGLLLLQDQLSQWLNAPIVAAVAPFLAIYVLFEMGGQLLNLTVVIEQQSILAAWLFFGFDALRTVALVLPVYLTGDIYWLAVGAAGYAVVRSIALLAWSAWTFRGESSRPLAPELLKGQVKYALPFGGSGILDGGLQRFHHFFISATFSPALYAVYSLGLQDLAPVRLFFSSLFDVVLVRMTEHFRDDRLDEVRRLWKRLLSGQAVLVVPLAVIMWVLAPYFIEGLFTAEYLGAVPVFRIALGALILTMVNDHAVLRACALTGFIFKATLAGLVASLISVPVLVSIFGLPGGAAGFVIGIGVGKAMGVWRIARRVQMPLIDCLPWSALLRYAVGAAGAVVITYPSHGWVDGPLYTFFISGGLFWLTYAALVWFGRLLTSEDRALLGRAIAPISSWRPA